VSELSLLADSEAARFRATQDWFVAQRLRQAHCVQVGASAERIVDLMHALSVHLDPAVDVALDDVRTARRWRGESVALPDVRDVVGRLRLPLASYGGVEFTVYTPQDQITLTPELLLVIYARTDRWTYLLDAMGLREREALPAPTWTPSRARLRPAPLLLDALVSAAARLGLEEQPA
jgi:hypothetical protein